MFWRCPHYILFEFCCRYFFLASTIVSGLQEYSVGTINIKMRCIYNCYFPVVVFYIELWSSTSYTVCIQTLCAILFFQNTWIEENCTIQTLLWLLLQLACNAPFCKISNSAQCGRFALILWRLVKWSFFCVF